MFKNLKKIGSLVPKILIDDSIKVAFAILGGIGIAVGFTSFSLDSVGKLPAQVGVVVLTYIILIIGTVYAKYKLSKNEIKLNIRGMTVVVKEGDIFNSKGWKLIPLTIKALYKNVFRLMVQKQNMNWEQLRCFNRL